MIEKIFKTLVVEDKTKDASVIKELFNNHPNYKVIKDHAVTVRQGKKFIDEYDPDFVLLDIELVHNKEGGIELAEYLHDKRATFAFLTLRDGDSRVVNLAYKKEPLAFLPKSDLGIDTPPLNQENKERRQKILMRLTVKLEQYFREKYILIGREKVQTSDIIYVKSLKNDSKKQKIDFYIEAKINPISSFALLIDIDKELKEDHPHFHYLKTKNYIINLDKIESIIKNDNDPKNLKYVFSFDNNNTLDKVTVSGKQLKSLTETEINYLHNKFPEVPKLRKKS